MKPWINTFSGQAVDLDNPLPEQIKFGDIAHALSRLQRWCGHSRRPFSVAEHSVVVAQLVKDMHPWTMDPQEMVLAALFHDAHEAYTNDVSSPLKTLLPELRAIQSRLQTAIESSLGIPRLSKSHAVITADLMSLSLERDQLLAPCVRDWGWDPPKPHVQIQLQCLDPGEAYDLFVEWCADFGVADARKIVDARKEPVDIDLPIPYVLG